MKNAPAAALVLALAFASPAGAMTVADLANGQMFVRAPVELDLGAGWASGRPTLIDRVAAERTHEAAQRFFAADTLLSLGAFALAGGAFAALLALGARRRKPEEIDETETPVWRESVFAAIQQDLARHLDAVNRHAA